MRALIVGFLLSASLSFAQNVPGSWGGYVSGWVSDAPRPSALVLRGSVDLQRPRLTAQQQQYLAVQALAAQQYFFAQQNYVQLQDIASRQQERLAQQQYLVEQQRRQAREEELAAQEQLLVQQQQLALQQQQLAQQQQQAAAEELARVSKRAEKLKQFEAEQKVQTEGDAARRALARAEADAKPREKGPDIHRWVDDDGVVHYSTKPRRH